MMNSIARISTITLLLLMVSGCSLNTESDTSMSGTISTGDTITDEIMATGEETIDTGIVTPSPILTTSLSGALADQVTISSPAENAVIANPLLITGSAPSNWFFEGLALVTIYNRNGLIIGEGYISTTGDRYSTELINFSGLINYTRDSTTPYNSGQLSINRNNKGSVSVDDEYFELPILFQ